MKRVHLGTLAIGVILLGYVLFAYFNGGITGRSGSIAVTRARDPIIFWIALALIALCGLMAFFYGLARITGRAVRFTARIDAIVGQKKQDES